MHLATTVSLSEYLRALAAEAIDLHFEAQLRAYRAAMMDHAARALLLHQARAGKFNGRVADALCGLPQEAPVLPVSMPARVSLSEREKTILRAISQGNTNKEVARQLIISPSTVGTHVERMFRKLGCSTRAAAVLKAQVLQLI